MAAGGGRRLETFLVPLVLVAIALFVASRGIVSDIGVYRGSALGFLAHGALPREYPPLAIVPMLLAQALARLSHVSYAGAWLGLSALVLYLLALAVGRPLVIVALLPLSPALLGTYDIWPILCLVLSYRLLPRRPALSWLLLGVAIAFKLFPILFIPLWWQTERRDWALALLPLLTLYPPAMASVVHYQFARQAEWESTVSFLSWLLGSPGMVLRHAFGAEEFYGRFSAALGIGLDAAYALFFVWIALLRRDLGLASRMLLLLSLWFLTNKVLSAQYVFWVVSLAYAAGQDLMLFGVLAWLTALLYPWFGVISSGLAGLFHLPRTIVWTMRLAMSLVGVRLALWLLVALRLLRRGRVPAQAAAVAREG